MTETSYSATFYENEQRGAAAGARVIVPLVYRLLHPSSVVDFGCGRGDFLREFRRLGAEVLGVDGEAARAGFPYGDGIPFVAHDLTLPLRIAPRSLAICLETAEHLDELFADTLVDTVTAAAPAVLWSAAVPGQGGTHHVNEQFPEYWARRFRRRWYVPFDVLRPLLLREPSVPCYYAQSAVLYIRAFGHREELLGGPFGSLLGAGHEPHRGYLPFYARDDWVPWMGRWLNLLPPRAREVVYRHYRRYWSRVGYKVVRPGQRFGD